MNIRSGFGAGALSRPVRISCCLGTKVSKQGIVGAMADSNNGTSATRQQYAPHEPVYLTLWREALNRWIKPSRREPYERRLSLLRRSYSLGAVSHYPGGKQ